MRSRCFFASSAQRLATVCGVGLISIFASTSAKGALITQQVTLLSPNSLNSYVAGSTTFNQFDPTLGTLDSVTFALVPENPLNTNMRLGTSYSNFSGSSGSQSYQLDTPTNQQIAFDSADPAPNSGTGTFTTLGGTSTSNLDPYIGTGINTLSLLALYTRSSGMTLSLSAFAIDGGGHPVDEYSPPQVAITYSYTLVPEPTMLSFVGAVGLLASRRRHGDVPE